MTKVIGVRFRTAGKIYYFDPKDIEFSRNDHVIVETARGVEFGTVVLSNTEVEDEKVVQPLKSIIILKLYKEIERDNTVYGLMINIEYALYGEIQAHMI